MNQFQISECRSIRIERYYDKMDLVYIGLYCGVDDERRNSLIFAGHVEEKAKVRISAPQGEKIIRYVDESIKNILKNTDNSYRADIALVFPMHSLEEQSSRDHSTQSTNETRRYAY